MYGKIIQFSQSDLLRRNVVPLSGMQRCLLLQLQHNYCLSSSVIDEFIRLLNMRQQEVNVERAGAACLRVLYLVTIFSSYIHPAAHNAEQSTAATARNVQKVLASATLLPLHSSAGLGILLAICKVLRALPTACCDCSCFTLHFS